MGKKHLSLIVIPHTKTSHRTLSFSKRTVRIITWMGIGLAVLSTAITVDYVRLRLSNHSYQSLIAENLKQKESLRVYENTVGSLERRINAFQEYTGKLNVFAGIKSPDLLQNPGVGGGPEPKDQISRPSSAPSPISQVRSTLNMNGLTQKADDIESNLNTLLSQFEGLRASFASTPSIAPTVGWHSSGFRYRLDPFEPNAKEQSFHYGLDIATAYGSPVVATADGSVIHVAYDGTYGNNIIINHGNGYTTLYGHLSKTLVRPGQKVKRNEVIGQVGHTGRALGDHVHYEVRKNGKPVNPETYILTEF